ncbi:hypothetical protein D3C81_895070 [compost metagenome]
MIDTSELSGLIDNGIGSHTHHAIRGNAPTAIVEAETGQGKSTTAKDSPTQVADALPCREQHCAYAGHPATVVEQAGQVEAKSSIAAQHALAIVQLPADAVVVTQK